MTHTKSQVLEFFPPEIAELASTELCNPWSSLEKDESLVVGAERGVDGRGVALGLDEEVMYFMF